MRNYHLAHKKWFLAFYKADGNWGFFRTSLRISKNILRYKK